MTLIFPMLRTHNLSTFDRFLVELRIVPIALTHNQVRGDVQLYSIHENDAACVEVSLRLHTSNGFNKVRTFYVIGVPSFSALMTTLCCLCCLILFPHY